MREESKIVGIFTLCVLLAVLAVSASQAYAMLMARHVPNVEPLTPAAPVAKTKNKAVAFTQLAANETQASDSSEAYGEEQYNADEQRYVDYLKAEEEDKNDPSHKKDFLLALAAAKKGDADSQAYLGKMYLEGIGVESNVKEAFYWTKKAAEAGQKDAEIQLGLFYAVWYRELGIPKDLDLAEKWILKVAKTGDVDAMEQLSSVLYDQVHSGRPERAEEANWWYYRASGIAYDKNYVPPSLKNDPDFKKPE